MTESDREIKQKVIQDIIGLAPHAEVASHVPGKVRLKLYLSGLKIIPSINFDTITQTIPGLVDMRVKTLSRSVEIDYDPRKLPSELWDDLDQIKHKPELAAQITERLQGLLN